VEILPRRRHGCRPTDLQRYLVAQPQCAPRLEQRAHVQQEFSIGHGGGLLDGGVGWYRKTFTLDSSYSGQQIRIEFDGVYMNSQVWINGTSLGTRPYGYSTFQYDLTKYAKTDGSNNVIAVRVDNNQPNSRWYSGSGIYRNVWLTVLNPVHVAYNGGFITTPSVSATSATVSVAADVENQSSSSQSVTITTENLRCQRRGGRKRHHRRQQRRRRRDVDVETRASLFPIPPLVDRCPVPLSGEADLAGGHFDRRHVYLVRSACGRTSFDPSTGFSLNDKSMKLWGMCMHHDLGAIGSAYNHRALERQFRYSEGHGRQRDPHVSQPASARAPGSRRPDGFPHHGRGLRRLGDRQRIARTTTICTSRSGLKPTFRTSSAATAIMRASSCGASATKSRAPRRRPRRS
jgi:hypothetical protein